MITKEFAIKRINEQKHYLEQLILKKDNMSIDRYNDLFDSAIDRLFFFLKELKKLEKDENIQ